MECLDHFSPNHVGLKYQEVVTTPRLIISVVFTWAVPLLCLSVAFLFERSEVSLVYIASYLTFAPPLCSLGTVLFYERIHRVFKKAEKDWMKNGNTKHVGKDHSFKMHRFVSVILLFTCFTQSIIAGSYLVVVYSPTFFCRFNVLKVSLILFGIANMLLIISCIVNPFMYWARHRDFRKGLAVLFCIDNHVPDTGSITTGTNSKKKSKLLVN
ncbi:uncharacterized protein LOC117117072 [Anneissia japonica]|uniref:uncharacterized protein LOC117117072 n=1 Tax=Anneissia japonica TaxID=1529436 RepID=UPI001425A880|nr:uncharacterized protein LOC117117072 [Anneissia japonica]